MILKKILSFFLHYKNRKIQDKKNLVFLKKIPKDNIAFIHIGKCGGAALIKAFNIVDAHKNRYSAKLVLTNLAKANLKKYYQKDFEFYNYVKSIKSKINNTD